MKVTKRILNDFTAMLESKLGRKLTNIESIKVYHFLDRTRTYESCLERILDLFLEFLKTSPEEPPSIKENPRGHRRLRPVEESEKED